MRTFWFVAVITAAAVLAPLAAAGQWVETTQTDFADGSFQSNMYSSGDGALCTNPGPVYDLNKDGHPDLVISNYWSGGNFDCPSFIYWGSDAGYSSANRTSLPTHGATANAVADLNRDGHLDILFSCFRTGGSYPVINETNSLIFWGSSTGFHGGDTTALPTMGAHGNSVCDLNHDGHLDIIFANFQDNDYHFEINSYIYWGGAAGYDAANRTELPTKAADDVSVADLNKDGRLDIVFSNRQVNVGVPDIFDTYSYIYYGQGTSDIHYDTTSRDSVHTHGAGSCTVVDLDRNGWLDLVFSNSRVEASYNIHSYIYYGSSAGYGPADMDSLQTHGSYDNTVADLNKDGRLDIVYANAESDFSTPFDTSYIYWGPDFAQRTGLPIRSGAGVMADRINNDGFLDIVMIKGIDQGYGYIFYGSQDGYSMADRDSFFTTRGGISTKDAGNVHDRSLTEVYQSSVFGDAAETREWGACAWNAQVPDGASIQVWLRTGNTADPEDGTWSAWAPVAKAGSPAKADPSKYVQYQYAATANDLYQGPSLDDFSLAYTVASGVAGSGGETAATGFTVRAQGAAVTMRYALGQPGMVTIRMYNLLGQQAAVLDQGYREAGAHQRTWSKQGALASGLYLVRAQLGRQQFTRRVVLLK